LADKQSGRPSGSIPSNTQPNPKGSSSKAYQPPQARNKHSEDEDEESTPQPRAQTPKPVKETPIPKPYKPKIPYPQCLRKEKMEAQYAENMLVEVGKFTFLVDFVIPKMEEDVKALLILGIPFLYTADAVIRVKQKQLNPGVEEYFDALLDEGSKILHSIEGTILEEKIFVEFDEFMGMTVDENSESDSNTE
ncbi:hypothetical protein Tco_0178801, partial [Tanacetum coccineum]